MSSHEKQYKQIIEEFQISNSDEGNCRKIVDENLIHAYIKLSNKYGILTYQYNECKQRLEKIGEICRKKFILE